MLELKDAIILGLSITAIILSVLAIIFEIIFFRIQSQQADSIRKDTYNLTSHMETLLSEIRASLNITGQQVKDQYDKLLDAAIGKNKANLKTTGISTELFGDINKRFEELEKAIEELKEAPKLRNQIVDLRTSLNDFRNYYTGQLVKRASEQTGKPEPKSRFEKFSERARTALTIANNNASLLKTNIGPEHILMAIIQDRHSLASKIITGLGVDLGHLKELIQPLLAPESESKPVYETGLTPEAKKVIELSVKESLRLKNNYIGTEHLLLGILNVNSAASKMLNTQNITLAKARAQTRKI